MRRCALLLLLTAPLLADDVEKLRALAPVFSGLDPETKPFACRGRALPLGAAFELRYASTDRVSAAVFALDDGTPLLVSDGKRTMTYDVAAGKVYVQDRAFAFYLLVRGDELLWRVSMQEEPRAFRIDVPSILHRVPTLKLERRERGVALRGRSKHGGLCVAWVDTKRAIPFSRLLLGGGRHILMASFESRPGEILQVPQALVPLPILTEMDEDVDPARIVIVGLRLLSRGDAPASHAAIHRVLCREFRKGPAIGGTRRGDAAVEGGQFETAVREYTSAAGNGDPAAMYSLALLHDAGKGTPRDTEEAYRLARRAAEMEHPDAQLVVGRALRTGTGVERDREAGLAWIAKAAEHGLAPAQFFLARTHLRKKEPEQAREWARKAALRGWAEAQTFLGILYVREQPANTVEAFAWLTLGAEGGHARGKGVLDRLTEMFSPGELQDAEARADELRERIRARLGLPPR